MSCGEHPPSVSLRDLVLTGEGSVHALLLLPLLALFSESDRPHVL